MTTPGGQIIGLDPGVETGCAIFQDSRLIELLTLTPIGALRFLEQAQGVRLVCVEDSRMQQAVFTAKGHGPDKALKIARDVGRIDQLCALIDAVCQEKKLQIVQISPLAKGKKLTHDEFLMKAPYWQKPSNPHTRDAFSVAWLFRHYRPRSERAVRQEAAV